MVLVVEAAQMLLTQVVLAIRLQHLHHKAAMAVVVFHLMAVAVVVQVQLVQPPLHLKAEMVRLEQPIPTQDHQ